MTRLLLAVLLALLTAAFAGCHLSGYGHNSPPRAPECDRWHYHEGSDTWHCHR